MSNEVERIVELNTAISDKSFYHSFANSWSLLKEYIDIKADGPNAVLELTSAEILALNTTPQTLVVAPGAGKATKVDWVMGTIDFLTAAYATNTTLEFRYTDGSGAKVATDMAALLNATADKTVTVGGLVTEVVVVENAPIVVNVATGDPVTGAGTVTLYAKYSVVNLNSKLLAE